jgi:hypothetical protein
MWHGGNLAIVIAIEALAFCRKHKHRNEMKWDEVMVDINIVASNKVAYPNMVWQIETW